MTADSPDQHATDLLALLDAIEAELVRRWPELPEPTPEAIEHGGAFGLATMAYAQWLRFVFVPIARRRVADGDLPGGSAVAVQAVREFDGDDDAAALITLLGRFDAMVGSST